MGSLIIQFHAVPEDMEDLISMLQSTVPEAKLYLRLKSRKFIEYKAEFNIDFQNNEVEWIVASVLSIDVSNTSFDKLIDTHPAALHIEVPEIRDNKVREIAASAKAWDERGDVQLKAWTRFFRKFRKQLHSGAFISSSQTGNGAFYKNAHATSRAVQAARNGLILCQADSVQYDYDRKTAA
jgi:hypothetical protein